MKQLYFILEVYDLLVAICGNSNVNYSLRPAPALKGVIGSWRII
jgi:hypothetical protein